MTRNCRVCGVELDDDNWLSSRQKNRQYICKECSYEKHRSWIEANRDKANAYQRLLTKNNPEKTKATWTKYNRNNGVMPMSKNKECAAYMGVYIGEPLFAKLFKNAKRMPYGNPYYDFICSNGKKIDVKISCIRKNGSGWSFNINYNTITDYFYLVAFDNREDRNLLRIWLIPGHVLNHLSGTSISQSTIHKWSEYEQDINEASA